MPPRRWRAPPTVVRSATVADTPQPNILVIWGDDIGITNLSCYSDGLMGYRTPNIDRIADEGMRFTDSYGEQSCTAGRAAFITGQSVLPHRAEQGRHAGRRVGLRPRTRRSPSCSSRSATPPASSARTTSATGTSSCRRCTASTSSSATSTTSTPRRSRSSRTTRRRRTSRASESTSGRAASSTAGPPTRTTTIEPRTGRGSSASRTPGR